MSTIACMTCIASYGGIDSIGWSDTGVREKKWLHHKQVQPLSNGGHGAPLWTHKSGFLNYKPSCENRNIGLMTLGKLKSWCFSVDPATCEAPANIEGEAWQHIAIARAWQIGWLKTWLKLVAVVFQPVGKVANTSLGILRLHRASVIWYCCWIHIYGVTPPECLIPSAQRCFEWHNIP